MRGRDLMSFAEHYPDIVILIMRHWHKIFKGFVIDCDRYCSATYTTEQIEWQAYGRTQLQLNNWAMSGKIKFLFATIIKKRLDIIRSVHADIVCTAMFAHLTNSSTIIPAFCAVNNVKWHHRGRVGYVKSSWKNYKLTRRRSNYRYKSS
jgi:hypothetical protein